MSYTGISQNMQSQMNRNYNGYNNNSAYISNQVQIPQTCYDNQNNMLHNNLNNNIELEQIEIIQVFIDGYHRRNHTSEPNPYKFIVDFGQEPKLEQTLSGVTTRISAKGIYLNKYDNGLERIKFVTIKALCVPKFISYTYTSGAFSGVNQIKTDVRYVVLQIKELVDEKKITSGDFMENNEFIFRYDKDLGSSSHIYITVANDTITYPLPIKNLKRLSISVYDDTDTLLELPTLTYDDHAGTGASRTRPFDFDTIIAELETAKATSSVNPFTDTSDSYDQTISQINIIKRRHQIQLFLDIGISTKNICKNIDYNH